MRPVEPVNILLVDDQPAKLLSYEAVLTSLGENLIRAGSAREALEQLLKNDVAVILVDVCMPDLDGFQLAAMIREHPRFKQTAMLFVSAVQLGDLDRIRGYQLGAVDYVPVPVIPELLRAKVKVFVELYRNARELEQVNQRLEKMVAERTAELLASNTRLNLAIDTAGMGTFDWDLQSGSVTASKQLAMLWFGDSDAGKDLTLDSLHRGIHPDDRVEAESALRRSAKDGRPHHHVFRLQRETGSPSWCDMRGQFEVGEDGRPVRMLGIVMDITEHKRAEHQQRLMIQELHHRVKNTLATVQSIAGLSSRTARDVPSFCDAFNSRIISLSRTHTLLLNSNWQRISVHDLLTNELESYEDQSKKRIFIEGPPISLPSQTGLALGLALHELTTNAVKYGALSVPTGKLVIDFNELENASGQKMLNLHWLERDGPHVHHPQRTGFGSTLLRRLFGDDEEGLQVKFNPAGLDVTLRLALAN